LPFDKNTKTEVKNFTELSEHLNSVMIYLKDQSQKSRSLRNWGSTIKTTAVYPQFRFCR